MIHAELAGTELYVPDNIHGVFYEGGIVALDTLEGEYRSASRELADIMKVVNQTGSVGAVVDHHKEQHPHLSAKDITTLVDHRLGILTTKGLVARGQKKEPRNFFEATPDNHILRVTPDEKVILPHTRQSMAKRITAVRSFMSAIKLTRNSFPAMEKEIRARQDNATRPATFEEGLSAGAAIMRAGQYYPGRFACLEETLATVLFGSSQGIKIDVQFGVEIQPFEFHVWPEAEGRAIHLSSVQSGNFYPLYRIS